MLNKLILDAGARIGELTKAIPKASGGDRRSENFKSDSSDTFEKPKPKSKSKRSSRKHKRKKTNGSDRSNRF